MVSEESCRVRLLPWTGPGGQPCYLIGAGEGYISRVADQIEDAQLGMGAELAEHASRVLQDPEVEDQDLRNLVGRLRESLCEALRVAESRGLRLPS
ncbi:hypothetical protein P8605_14300 [Streptomyces sp. T-3]|nr:hypothetical protein [Streptomyces sp. T-3]